MEPIQRVNVDFAAPMLHELDRFAKELNISRQAVIKLSSARASISATSPELPASNRNSPPGCSSFFALPGGW
jgi:hypothetical protein